MTFARRTFVGLAIQLWAERVVHRAKARTVSVLVGE